MTRAATRSVGFFAIVFLASLAALAYEVPLDSHSIREAYFLGQRNDEKMSRFLDAYVKHLPLPRKGPYVSEVRLLTPYAQVVDLSRQRTTGYSAQQAEQDYHDRGDTILVLVRIELTPTYGLADARSSAEHSGAAVGYALRPEDFWKDFKIGLSQNDKWIDPLDIHGEPTYSPLNAGASGRVMDGALVYLEFNASDIASGGVSVEVFTPDDQHVVATFDLEKLR
jgi:hypothetical protein